MTTPRDMEKLLADGLARGEAMFPGIAKHHPELIEHWRRSARPSIALGIVRDLSAATKDHWSVGSLREALRDIHYLAMLIDAEQREILDTQVMSDPKTLQNLMDLPDDADQIEIMRALGERLNPPDDGDPGERVKEPA